MHCKQYSIVFSSFQFVKDDNWILEGYQESLKEYPIIAKGIAKTATFQHESVEKFSIPRSLFAEPTTAFAVSLKKKTNSEEASKLEAYMK